MYRIRNHKLKSYRNTLSYTKATKSQLFFSLNIPYWNTWLIDTLYQRFILVIPSLSLEGSGYKKYIKKWNVASMCLRKFVLSPARNMMESFWAFPEFLFGNDNRSSVEMSREIAKISVKITQKQINSRQWWLISKLNTEKLLHNIHYCYSLSALSSHNLTRNSNYFPNFNIVLFFFWHYVQ